MSDQPSPPTETPQREIRVFVSSTFGDMQAERDELVLRIFPRLRKLCEQRGVTWGEVDLNHPPAGPVGELVVNPVADPAPVDDAGLVEDDEVLGDVLARHPQL